MNRKTIAQHHLPVGKGLSRILLTFIFAIFYIIYSTTLMLPKTYASGVPGGNISDPVVQGVDIAKPAIVRILAKVTGHLTVYLPTVTGTTMSILFPQNEDAYKVEYSGSGAFISAHGDILTANHLVHPSPDILYQTASQDVADYFNKRSTQPITATDVLAALTNGSLKSQAQYDQPTMRVYLGTDFTGPTNATSLNDMPQGTYADVNSTLKTTDFEHGDTAIIHVPMDDTPSIKLADSTNVTSQDQLTLIGFPGNGDLLRENGRTLTDLVNPSTGFFTPSLNKVYVSAIKQSHSGAPLIQIGGNIEHGDSGGPALASNGNIVGIASFVGTDTPSGTGFLQASNTAQQLINELQLNTQPGTFQSTWNKAFTAYSSNQTGHWHNAQLQLQKLQNTYPNFHAIQPFLDYATAQAKKETSTNPSPSTNPSLWIGIALLVLVVIALLVLFLLRRKKGPQTTLATQPATYPSSHYQARPSPMIEPITPSGGIAQIDSEESTDEDDTDRHLAQPRATQKPPQVMQTPTPIAAYNTAQSGPFPVVPDQPAPNPWPQAARVPVYGQPAPYSQQPYNATAQPRPGQEASYPPYPAQLPFPQQPYIPYSQVPVTPWPAAPDHTPPPRTAAPYAPQNPAQQGTPIQYRQQTPAYRTPYSQPLQDSGAMRPPTQPRPMPPAQPSQQSSESTPAQTQRASVPPPPDASTPSADDA